MKFWLKTYVRWQLTSSWVFSRVTDESCGLLLKKYEDSYAKIIDSMDEQNGMRKYGK